MKLNFFKFCESKWLMKNWLLTVPLNKAKSEFKENERLQKKYFILKWKKDKWQDLTHAEKLDKMRFNWIIWK